MANRRKVLVVAPDPAELRAAAVALRRRGFEVHAARDGPRALHLAVTRSPAAVLVCQDAPLLDAPTLVRILRANPRTAGIPVLLAGDPPSPGGPHASGEDGRRRTFDADEAAARVQQALWRSEATRATSGGAGLRGNLEETPLADVLQVLAANRRTGRLAVDGASGRAEVVLEDGQITDAASGECAGEKALFRTLARRRGRFSFAPRPAAGPGRIARRLEDLLLDGARQADEVARLAPALPPPDAPLILEGGGPPEPRDSEATTAWAEVRSLLAVPRTLREVLDGAGAPDLEVLQAVEVLLGSGALRAGEPPAPGQPATERLLPPAAVQALRGRVLRGRVPGAHASGKLLLAGGGPLARRTALARFAALPGFAAVTSGGGVAFGTMARLAVAPDLAVDVLALPGDPALAPLWRPFASGALAALVLLPADGLAPRLAELAASGDIALGICGPSGAALDPELRSVAGAWPFLGPDPALALRTLLEHAARAQAPERG